MISMFWFIYFSQHFVCTYIHVGCVNMKYYVYLTWSYTRAMWQYGPVCNCTRAPAGLCPPTSMKWMTHTQTAEDRRNTYHEQHAHNELAPCHRQCQINNHGSSRPRQSKSANYHKTKWTPQTPLQVHTSSRQLYWASFLPSLSAFMTDLEPCSLSSQCLQRWLHHDWAAHWWYRL